MLLKRTRSDLQIDTPLLSALQAGEPLRKRPECASADGTAEASSAPDSGHKLTWSCDIGGSLIKIVWVYVPREVVHPESLASPGRGSACNTRTPMDIPTSTQHPPDLQPHVQKIMEENPNMKFNFVSFLTSELEQAFEFLEENGLLEEYSPTEESRHSVMVTGGGAYKYSKLFEERYNVNVQKVDEMVALVRGLNFALKNCHTEAFTVHPLTKEHTYLEPDSEIFPFLVVNVGSGISILKVDGEDDFKRVSGSSVGGGTFFALARLITDVSNYDDILELCHKGRNEEVDMLVGDIYGGDYSALKLPASTIACSCGRVLQSKIEEGHSYRDQFSKASVLRSLLFMFANNTAQIASLNAQRFGLKHIYFTGSFIRDHPDTLSNLAFGIYFWSNGEIEPRFLKHEGYVGALGAYLTRFMPSRSRPEEAALSTATTSAAV